MLTQQRHEIILKLLKEKGSITVTEVRDLLDTSESTVRRDITALDKEGKLEKVFGGAVEAGQKVTAHEYTVAQKNELNCDAKRKIAEYAASLIEPDDFVFLDAGTTTAHMIDFIRATSAVFVTNAVDHGQMILHKGNYNGKQLVPESYMKMATSNLVDNSVAGSPGNLYSGFGYGYQFVMNPEAGSYRSDGNYGQFCLAFPDKDVVVTVMSLEGDFQKIGNHLWTTVIPEL